MEAYATKLHGVILVKPTLHSDERGWFQESFNPDVFRKDLHRLHVEVPNNWHQDNHSLSLPGVLRGLHYQEHPHAQAKLVRVVRGIAFDVVVDLRPWSPTFKQHITQVLSASNRYQLFIPDGCAHGFLAQAQNEPTEVLYKTDWPYAEGYERAIRWDDPTLNISWPLWTTPTLSKKDAEAPYLSEVELL